jgi:hypothetical protein
MGNVTYVASILLASVERDFLLGQLPYLLGRCGDVGPGRRGRADGVCGGTQRGHARV